MRVLVTGTSERIGRRLLAAGVILASLLTPLPAFGASVPRAQPGIGEATAHTANGAVRGLAKGGIDEFLGVPFAAPPVRALRWRPPQPATSWLGVRDATRFAPDCAQLAGPFGRASTSEDCLYLNVYTPSQRRAGSRSPVMVWMHGGGLTGGAGSLYDPTALVKEGVTVVTINYRLGALGFLAHPALADAHGQSGDYGLMDQQAALRWVQRNIAAFGANPHNVTIFGESAGGVSALAQVASPRAAGLFQRAIAESGTYNLTQPTLAAAETSGKAFAAEAACASQIAVCLRHLPVSTILANQPSQYVPTINTQVLPDSLGTAFATGHFNRVPIVNGTNRDEWRLFVAAGALSGNAVTATNYQAMISSTLGVPVAQAAVIADKYALSAYPNPSLALSAVGTDAIFACPALTIDRSASRFVPTFAYEFNDQNAPENFLPPVSFPYGATHASELQYLLGLPDASFPGTLSAQQQELAATMKTYWTSFAKRGLPATPGTPHWLPFNIHTQMMESLVVPAPRAETDFASTHNCAFWAGQGL
jgi:para-nitrobenzyl esterase